MKLRRCPQHWGFVADTEFLSDKPGAMCSTCRGRARRGEQRTPAERRARLGRSPNALPTVLVMGASGNQKLGGIPATISSAETCPDACSLKGNGCYAEQHVLAFHWRGASERGLFWSDFLCWVRALPAGQLWRHNTAGDLAGGNDELDVDALDELVDAARATRGFSFTHKPLRSAHERDAIAHANDGGFTINLSADSLPEADRKLALGIAPVVSLVPHGTRTGDRSGGGHRIVVCPAQLHDDVTCRDCGLCRNAYRQGLVGFLPHGQLGSAIARRLPVVQRAPLTAAPAA
jgi:hypothetical protein